MTDARYNARTAERRWQRRWERARPAAAAPLQPAAAAPAMTLRELRRCILADTTARFQRARGVTMSGTAGATADPLLRSLAIAIPWGPASSRDGAAPPAAAVPGHDDDAAGLVDAYGADATRWYLVGGTPADAAAAAATGSHGAWRFVHRLWRVVNTAAKIAGPLPAPDRAGVAAGAADLRASAHRALAQVTTNLDTARFGLAVASVHGFTRVLQTALAASAEPATPDLKIAAREAAEILVHLFQPMMPHLAEECWAALGHREPVSDRRWPATDGALVMAGTVTLAVHVNGRRRAEVTVARDAPTGDIAASVFALTAVRQALAGRAPRNVIVVPQRIINVVA